MADKLRVLESMAKSTGNSVIQWAADEIARLTAERDAAILERRAANEEAEDWSRRCGRILDERDAARARVAELEAAPAANAGGDQQEPVAWGVRFPEGQIVPSETREWAEAKAKEANDRVMAAAGVSDAVKCVPLYDAPFETQAMTDLLRRLAQWDHMATAADGPYWIGEIKKVLSGAAAPPPRGWLTAEEREASTEAMKCMTKIRRERDEANAECDRLRVAHLKAALERDRANEARGRIRSEWTRRGQALHAAQQAIGALRARVAELEAAPPPRGWLTAEEREAVDAAADAIGDRIEAYKEQDGDRRRIEVLDGLFARETPPKVKVPAWLHADVRGVVADAIRAAGGEVEG